jgi:hypothetical protein|tara:strand:+ start:148 stop:291 length:144 start_codon:yes stop_codon:yes gene_type:complete
MDTAERETTLLGAAAAWKESEDESIESAIDILLSKILSDTHDEMGPR